MIIPVVIILASISSQANHAEFRSNKVLLDVSVESSVYTYRITNLNDDAIVGFKISQHAGHSFTAPENWDTNSSSNIFESRTGNVKTGIQKNQTGTFSFNVGTKGAILGRSIAEITFHSGINEIIPDVWAPTAEPKSYITLVGVVVTFIILFNAALVIKKHRNRKNVQYN